MKKYQLYFLILTIYLLLNGCGSDAAKVHVAGVVTYTFVPVTHGGLDYQASEERPIRGAVVQVVDVSQKKIISQGTTDERGHYSLQAEENTTVFVRVRAELGNPEDPNTRVVDNTKGDSIYLVEFPVEVVKDPILDVSFNATTTFNENRDEFNRNRNGAPFAILDTIYTSQQKIKSVDSAVDFPFLSVNWSINNNTNAGTLAEGDIGTSFYSDGELYILGAADNDTDEYDAHVIAHEWAHYFEDKLSRADSIGGRHGEEDILDATVAFSEGFGNAWAGMMLDEPLYYDTAELNQATVALELNLEKDSVSDTLFGTFGNGDHDLLFDGFYSESSVHEILFDLYDGEGVNTDSDGVQVAFKDIYGALVGQQKETPAFTTIFSFIAGLKAGMNGLKATQVDRLAEGENIRVADAFGSSNTVSLYQLISPDSTKSPGETLGFFNNDSESDSLDSNRLYNRQFFRFNISATGCYRVTISDVDDSSADVFVHFPNSFLEFKSGVLRDYDKTGEHALAVASRNGSRFLPITYSLALSSASGC